jgi:group I intron endonuclease
MLTNIENNAGIYEIYNTVNNKRYIGQSIHVRTRLLKHINLLRKNKHPNKHLQSSWNYHGEECFTFNALEYCTIETLDLKEDLYIAKYKTNDRQFGFNYRVDNKTNRGLKWSPEQREKMTKAIEASPWFHNHVIPQSTLEKAWEASRAKVWTQEERDKHSKILKGTKVADTSRMKLAQQGERNPSCKITEDMVKEIIMLLKNNYCSVALLADIYGVTQSNIRVIEQGRSWKHLDRTSIEEQYFLSGVKKVDEYNKSGQEGLTKTAV